MRLTLYVIVYAVTRSEFAYEELRWKRMITICVLELQNASARRYVDLGTRVLDGTRGISLLLWARISAPTNTARDLPPTPYTRMFDAGSGCINATASCATGSCFACDSTFFLGTGKSGANLYAGASASRLYDAKGAGGASAETTNDGLPGSKWVALALTLDPNGIMRLFSNGINIWVSTAQGGLPAAVYPTVYLGRSQNPKDLTRWRGALANVQLYFSELPALAVARLAVGDSSACPVAPPPPGGKPASRANATGNFPYARVAAPDLAARWLATPSAFDEQQLWRDVIGKVPLATSAYWDPRNDWVDLRGGGALALAPMRPLPASAQGITIAAWVRWDSGAGDIAMWGDGISEPQVGMGVRSNGRITATHSPSAVFASVNMTVITERPLVPVSWMHVQASWSSKYVTIFLNGLPNGQGPSSGVPPTVARAAFRVGPLRGALGDLQLYFTASVSAADLYGGYADTGYARPPPPPAPPPSPPQPPAWVIPPGENSEGGRAPNEAMHLWLPYPELGDAPGTLQNQGTKAALAYFAPLAAGSSATFVKGAWNRTAASSMTTDSIFLPVPCAVVIRFRFPSGPPTNEVVLWTWAGNVNFTVTVQNSVIKTYAGTSSTFMEVAKLSDPKAAVRAKVSWSVSGGVWMTIDDGSIRYARISGDVFGTSYTNINSAKLSIPPCASCAMMVSELYISGNNDVFFAPQPPPPSPPLKPSPPPPPPRPPPIPPMAPYAVARSLAQGGASHGWLPGPRPLEWGATASTYNGVLGDIVASADSAVPLIVNTPHPYTTSFRDGGLIVNSGVDVSAVLPSFKLPALIAFEINSTSWDPSGTAIMILTLPGAQYEYAIVVSVIADNIVIIVGDTAIIEVPFRDWPIVMQISSGWIGLYAGTPSRCILLDSVSCNQTLGDELLLPTEAMSGSTLSVLPQPRSAGSEFILRELWIADSTLQTVSAWPSVGIYAPTPPLPPAAPPRPPPPSPPVPPVPPTPPPNPPLPSWTIANSSVVNATHRWLPLVQPPAIWNTTVAELFDNAISCPATILPPIGVISTQLQGGSLGMLPRSALRMKCAWPSDAEWAVGGLYSNFGNFTRDWEVARLHGYDGTTVSMMISTTGGMFMRVDDGAAVLATTTLKFSSSLTSRLVMITLGVKVDGEKRYAVGTVRLKPVGPPYVLLPLANATVRWDSGKTTSYAQLNAQPTAVSFVMEAWISPSASPSVTTWPSTPTFTPIPIPSPPPTPPIMSIPPSPPPLPPMLGNAMGAPLALAMYDFSMAWLPPRMRDAASWKPGAIAYLAAYQNYVDPYDKSTTSALVIPGRPLNEAFEAGSLRMGAVGVYAHQVPVGAVQSIVMAFKPVYSTPNGTTLFTMRGDNATLTMTTTQWSGGCLAGPTSPCIMLSFTLTNSTGMVAQTNMTPGFLVNPGDADQEFDSTLKPGAAMRIGITLGSDGSSINVKASSLVKNRDSENVHVYTFNEANDWCCGGVSWMSGMVDVSVAGWSGLLSELWVSYGPWPPILQIGPENYPPGPSQPPLAPLPPPLPPPRPPSAPPGQPSAPTWPAAPSQAPDPPLPPVPPPLARYQELVLPQSCPPLFGGSAVSWIPTIDPQIPSCLAAGKH